jgi:hypothetical protein
MLLGTRFKVKYYITVPNLVPMGLFGTFLSGPVEDLTNHFIYQIPLIFSKNYDNFTKARHQKQYKQLTQQGILICYPSFSSPKTYITGSKTRPHHVQQKYSKNVWGWGWNFMSQLDQATDPKGTHSLFPRLLSVVGISCHIMLETLP